MEPRADALDPRACDAFALIRRLECRASAKPRVGCSLFPSEEDLSFGQVPSLAFATSTIAGLQEQRGRTKVLLNCFGLLGPNAPLPLHLTEHVRDRLVHSRDPTTLDFLDMLSSRLASMFYRAWAINQPAVWHDRPDNDRFAFYMRCLVGIGTDGLKDREHVPDEAKLLMAGHHASLPRNAEGVEAIVESWFGVPCRVEQMVGRWLRLPEDTWSIVNSSSHTARLSNSATLGERVWDAQQTFRVRLGPMALDDYESLLPGEPGFEELADLIRFYAGLEYAWTAQLVLRADCVPMLNLGAGGRLGYTTWLGGGPGHDRDDLTIAPHV